MNTVYNLYKLESFPIVLLSSLSNSPLGPLLLLSKKKIRKKKKRNKLLHQFLVVRKRNLRDASWEFMLKVFFSLNEKLLKRSKYLLMLLLLVVIIIAILPKKNNMITISKTLTAWKQYMHSCVWQPHTKP